ncbi:MAG: DUF512 domain-containing protein [Coriobacteriales bacterium]|jgi:NifB/MoaA-like Fe-S oxidoreductase|nr:DUF512 domain-containing protein [Coriobacteriales bacterium]
MTQEQAPEAEAQGRDGEGPSPDTAPLCCTASYAPTEPPGTHGAVIAGVDPASPGEKGGLVAGMRVLSVEGVVPRDVLDWMWLASDAEVHLTACGGPQATAADGAAKAAAGRGAGADAGTARTSPHAHVTAHTLRRGLGEDWGVTFADPLFDGLMTCRNSCVFCFMTMLPKGMRPSLYLRDDDYRLSFLQGNFVTLTNLGEDDVRRIVDYRLSPLHVSLHAVGPAVRRRLIGANHARGIEVLDRLLDAGIEAHAQVVVVPGINDGAELDLTLGWAARRPGILSLGVVPYGHTRFARLQAAFRPDDARRVIAQLAPWQERSREAEGATRFQLADEWYLLAGAPPAPAEHYDGYPQFEDGIGMLRAFEDEWEAAAADDTRGTGRAEGAGSAEAEGGTGTGTGHAEGGGGAAEDAGAAGNAGAEGSGAHLLLVTGEAFAPTLRRLVTASFPHNTPEVRAIRNRFFGGNVNVTGLLTAQDVVAQLKEQGTSPHSTVVLPCALFNPDGLTLDDKQAADIARALGRRVVVASAGAEGAFEACRLSQVP